MRVSIVRDMFTPHSTLGKILIDGAFQCYSLERALHDPEHAAIPEGLYKVQWYASPHNNLIVPLLLDVPGRSMIEIHPANFPEQLEGCIAPGSSRGDDSVSQSRTAWSGLVSLMHQVSEADIFVEVTHA